MENKNISKEELTRLTKIIKEAITYVHNNLSNLSFSDKEGQVKIDSYQNIVFTIHGGLNGNGRWNNYFDGLSKLVSKLSNSNLECQLIEMKIDEPDDVFTATFKIRMD